MLDLNLKKNIPISEYLFLFQIRADGIRTHDQWLKRPLLYQLSYRPITGYSMLYFALTSPA